MILATRLSLQEGQLRGTDDLDLTPGRKDPAPSVVRAANVQARFDPGHATAVRIARLPAGIVGRALTDAHGAATATVRQAPLVQRPFQTCK